jgi:predicted nuclease of predicted toxin-antitoxin system
MRMLLDENLSPILRDLLADAGHDVVHVRDL